MTVMRMTTDAAYLPHRHCYCILAMVGYGLVLLAGLALVGYGLAVVLHG